MTIENLFRPGKWLVIFCALFICLWLTLQYVSNSRLKSEAEAVGNAIFTWSWPGQWASNAEITDVSVVHKTDSDAIVMVKGRQKVTYANPPQPAGGDENESVDCNATLTFYKMSGENPKTKQVEDYWVLGKVEFP